MPLPAKAVQVAAGEDTSFALLDDGTGWAWGRGYSGTLGADLNGADRTARAGSGAQGLLGVKGNQRVPTKVPMEKLLPPPPVAEVTR